MSPVDTDPLTAVQWTETYRPTSLADVAMDSEERSTLQAYIDSGEIPHLLLVGPPGTGKTTVARILYRSLDCRVLTLNASADRGIDIVRDRIGTFVSSMGINRWNIVFLDEADALTQDAQTALRNLIEAHADRARFILSGNYGHRIIQAIQSRCQQITLGRPPLKERYRILTGVLQAEGIEAEPQVALGYAERYPDLRRMLMQAQKMFLPHAASTGERTLPPAQQDGPVDGVQILDMIRKKNHMGLRRLTSSSSFDPLEGLREAFWAVPDDDPQCGFLRHILGRGVHESGFTPDPVVLFLGVCAEASEGV